MPDPFIKRQAQENQKAKAVTAEDFRAKEAQSLTKSVGTIDTSVKPLVQRRQKDDDKPQPYTKDDVFQLPSNVVRVSTFDREVIPEGPDYATQKFAGIGPSNPYQIKTKTDIYSPQWWKKGMSYGEIFADNLIGIDNGYDTVLEKLAAEFNEDELTFMKNMAVGAYEGAVEFISDPLGSISSYATDIIQSGKDLWGQSLEKRLMLMFDVTPENATESQLNQAREGVWGDVLRVTEGLAVTKIAKDLTTMGVKAAKDPVIDATKTTVEKTKNLLAEKITPYIDEGIGLDSKSYKLSAIEQINPKIPTTFKDIRGALAEPSTENVFGDIKSLTPIQQRVQEKLKQIINVDEITLANQKPTFNKNTTIFSLKPEEAAVVDKETKKVITPRKKRTPQDQFIQEEIKVEKASPYLFEYVTPQSVANFNNNPINRGLPEDINFINDNSYLSSTTFTNNPVTFYNGRPFKTGKGIQTFSPLVRALNNYPDYNNIKTKKIISPKNIWKHLSSSTVNKKQSLAFTGGEKLFAYKSYQWFWEKGFIPDDHEIRDVGNTLNDADEYYNVIEKYLDKYNNEVKRPTSFTYLDRATGTSVTMHEIKVGNEPFIFDKKESFNNHTQLTNNDFFNFINKDFQVLNKSSLGGALPFTGVVNFEVDVYTNAGAEGAGGKSLSSLLVERDQSYLDEQAIKDWNSKQWVEKKLEDYDSGEYEQLLNNRRNYVLRFGGNPHTIKNDALSSRNLLHYSDEEKSFQTPRYATIQTQVAKTKPFGSDKDSGAGYVWDNEEIFDEATQKLIKENKIGENVVERRIIEINKYLNKSLPLGGYISVRVPRDTRNYNFQDFLNRVGYDLVSLDERQVDQKSYEDLFFEVKSLNMQFAEKDIELSKQSNQSKFEFAGINDSVVMEQMSQLRSLFKGGTDKDNYDKNQNLKFHETFHHFNNRQRLGSELAAPSIQERGAYTPTIKKENLKFNTLIQFFTQATAPYVLKSIEIPAVRTKNGDFVEGGITRNLLPLHTRDNVSSPLNDRSTIGISGIAVANPLTYKINKAYEQVENKFGKEVTTKIVQDNVNLQNLKAHRFVNIPFIENTKVIKPISLEGANLISNFTKRLVLSKDDNNFGVTEKFPVIGSNLNPIDVDLDADALEAKGGISKNNISRQTAITPDQNNFAINNNHEFDISKLFVIKELDPNLYEELVNEMISESYNKNSRLDNSEAEDILKYEIDDFQNIFNEDKLPIMKNFYAERSFKETAENLKNIQETLTMSNDYKLDSSIKFVFSRDTTDISDLRSKAIDTYTGEIDLRNLSNLELLRELTDIKREKTAFVLRNSKDKSLIEEYKNRLANFKNGKLLTDYVEQKDELVNKFLLRNKLNKDVNNQPIGAGKTRSDFQKFIMNKDIMRHSTAFHGAGSENLGHTRFIYSPNGKIALLNEVQLDGLQDLVKREEALKLASTSKIDTLDSFGFNEFTGGGQGQKQFKKLVEDLFGNSGIVKTYLDKYVTKSEILDTTVLDETNFPKPSDDFLYSINKNNRDSNQYHGHIYGNLKEDDLRSSDGLPYIGSFNFEQKYKLTKSVFNEKINGYQTEIVRTDGKRFKIEDLIYINDLTTSLKIMVKKDPYNKWSSDFAEREQKKNLFEEFRIENIRNKISDGKKLNKDQALKLLLYEQTLKIKDQLSSEIPNLDLNVTFKQRSKDKDMYGIPEVSLYSFINETLNRSNGSYDITDDILESQFDKDRLNSKIFLTFSKPKSRTKKIKEVEKKLEKEIQIGYLPVENEVEVIEKLMLSLVLEAKRNGAEKIVIPPFERIQLAREVIGKNQPRLEKRYNERLNKALNNIIEKSGGKIKGLIEEKDYLKIKDNWKNRDYFEDPGDQLDNVQKYKVRVLDIRELFKDMPKDQEVGIKIGMAQGGLVA